MSYHSELDYSNEKKINELLKELPGFISQFDDALDNQGKATRTRINYIYDYILFFDFLLTLDIFSDKSSARDFTIKDLEKIRKTDINRFLKTFNISRRGEESEYSKNKANKGKCLKARKIASLRSLYSYFIDNEDIIKNPLKNIDPPKINEPGNPVVLSPDEVKRIFHCIDTGDGLGSSKQIALAAKTKRRDKAIFALLLGTGIRVSECIGLDVNDVDFDKASLSLIRKGGDTDEAYFSEEVESIIYDYLINERDSLKPDTDAFFVSSTHGRLTVRAVEYMVRKYALAAGITKNIKVHSLRATYATEIYSETKDLYMVKDALHHSSLNTSKHYINGKEERKRKAAVAVKGLFS